MELKVNPDNSSLWPAEAQTVIWQRYKQPENQMNKQIILLTGRFTSKASSSSAQLYIKGLQVTDVGFYSCRPVFTVIKGESDVTQLIITASPAFQDTSTLPQLEVNKTRTLSCKIVGFYPKQFKMEWLKGGNQLRQQHLHVATNRDGTFSAESTILFVPQLNDHNKMITCRVTHQSVKTPIQWSQKLNVLYGPVDLRVEPGNNVVKMKGDLLELSCKANSNPQAQMSWLLNGKVLLTATTNHLMIKVENITSSKQGNYTCSAENKLGRRESVVMVTVIDRPISNVIARYTLVIAVSLSVVLLLIILIPVATCAIVKRCRATRWQEEEPVYMVSSQPTADVYDTLTTAGTEEPSAQQKATDSIYANI
ncbi:sialic acid-binding Ig-like lectin 14 isoform X2 [Heptranchias perlo]